ncbi:MAG: N-acetyltransferase [Candidatus Marinimicrobia bacterium]|jgi:RimJ/RimL family protein N-acetyltransferase|nr:N-acetyltransferase [Candidatus Neomarinimicrobiota bacterium]MBT3937649.1 N-acetyltransferase [Candidatus Neomarinimicrobiota bacterium]MBT3962363.1 N-acetyltransferase [Candidatus Neomarinimicrobiota bacterium]MBT4383506.1 N-acetyltransferase [Candidatus Neomarinimicrobiota bacterium]MBT4635585.1 N-acetyltransferase [Candidatus Neomarinimicrobiota bacterium]
MIEKTFLLKNNSKITIRDLSLKDVNISLAFFKEIPESKRRYFRSDVTNIGHLKERALQSEKGKIIRRIALMDGEIVGDTSIEISSDLWTSGTAYLRLVVPKQYIGKGIQFTLAKDLYDLAQEKKLNKITTKFMRPQKDLMKIYSNLGFKLEGVLPDYVHDLKGKEQDMVVMFATLDDLKLAHQFIGEWLDSDHSSVGAGEM